MRFIVTAPESSVFGNILNLSAHVGNTFFTKNQYVVRSS